MKPFSRFRLLITIAIVLFACQRTPTPGSTPSAATVSLVVQTQNGTSTFKQAGEVIPYNYIVTNTGSASLAGPVHVADAPRQVSCPGLNTVGNLDDKLDRNETIICIALHTVTDGDVSNGSITNLATATVGGVNSNPAGITLTLDTGQPTAALQLEITADPQTYAQAGQVITYSYRITNTGTTTLGPAQFTISDDRLGPPFPCGPGDTTLTPNMNMNCSAVYTISQVDVSLVELTNRATASGGGQTSAVAAVTIPNLNNPLVTATPTATLASIGTLVIPTAGTPVGVTPDLTSLPPIRISFGVGETTTVQAGILNPNQMIRYILSAAAGQVLSIHLTTGANEIHMGVNDPTGAGLKLSDATLTWSTTIPTDGDYTIYLSGPAGIPSTPYTLQVGLMPSP